MQVVMTAPMIFVVLGNLIFLIATSVIGTRLLRLGFRTREWPETLLGAGFLFMMLAIPFLALSGLGRFTVGDVRVVPAAEGLLALALAVGCMSGFVWQTFHPDRRWVVVLPLAVAACEIAILHEVVRTLAATAPSVPASEIVRDTIILVRFPMTITFFWMAIEGARAHRKARKREAVGLGSPVVTNRFFLFALTGTLAGLNTTVSTVLHMHGMTPFAHPAAAACFAIGSTLGATTLLLAFLPPHRYTAWIEARVATASLG